MSVVEKVGEAVLAELLEREDIPIFGLASEISNLKMAAEYGGEDTEIWNMVVQAIGKAAIKALREPSDRMGAQGLRANMGKGRAHCLSEDEMEAVGWDDHLAGNPSKWMKPTWRAMIDAALED